MSEPRWLTPEQQQTWLQLAGVIIRLPAVLDADMQRRAGITQFEYLVMAMLSEAPDRTLRMSTLAARTSSSLSRLSHVAARLERRGWVRRAPNLEDGRSINATLTETGWDKVVDTAPGHVETVRSLVIDALSPAQLQHLDQITGRILQRIEDDGTCPVPLDASRSPLDTTDCTDGSDCDTADPAKAISHGASSTDRTVNR